MESKTLVTEGETENSLLGIDSRNLRPLSDTAKRSANIKRYLLQSAARHLLPGNRRLNACHRMIVTENGRVTVKYAAAIRKARYAGLAQCVQVWTCPVCTGRVAEKRKLELYAATARAKEYGYRPLMITFTLRHGFDDPLSDLLRKLVTSYRQMTSYRAYKRLKDRFTIIGTIRALEVTYHTGWHPHLHVLAFAGAHFVETADQVRRLETELESMWLTLLEKNGGNGITGIACTVKAGNEYIAEYISKYGHLPEEKTWSLESELTGAAAKRSRGEAGISPFGLLEQYALNGAEDAASLFIEYAAAMKGKSQLQWSRGLADALGLQPESDEAIIDFLPPEFADLLTMDWSVWSVILASGIRGEFLDKIQELVGDYEQIAQYIEGIMRSVTADESV